MCVENYNVYIPVLVMYLVARLGASRNTKSELTHLSTELVQIGGLFNTIPLKHYRRDVVDKYMDE